MSLNIDMKMIFHRNALDLPTWIILNMLLDVNGGKHLVACAKKILYFPGWQTQFFDISMFVPHILQLR